jgi:carbon-monoxide dehydrogenase medium subunit
VRPVPFALDAPETLEEALRLANADPEALILAGGQTLIPLMNMRIVRPEHVIDLTGISALRSIEASGEGLSVGAMVRQCELESSPLVASASPVLARAVRSVGQPQTRSRGTVGGSIALGSAVAELCVTLAALGGRVKVQHVSGARWIQAEDFFRGYLTIDIAPAEIVTEVGFPTLGGEWRWGFSELKLRGCDFPIVVAVALVRVVDQRCADVRLAVGGVANVPTRVPAIEAALAGRAIDDPTLERLPAIVEANISPSSDVHAPAPYRRRVAGIEVAKAVSAAVATGGGRA